MNKRIRFKKCFAAQAGFTLVEMSVVLVIIAFIMAAIMGARVLIRQTQVTSVMTDVQSYIRATKTFQQKYAALPGDMPNATSFWGAMQTCPPPPNTTSPGGTATCNGNGDGQVFNMGALSGQPESLLFWQHLANAQMIPGHYTGISGGTVSGQYQAFEHDIGINCPASKIDGAGYGFFYLGSVGGNGALSNGSVFNGIYGHVFWFGLYQQNWLPQQPAVTGGETYSLDSKFDDGIPNQGNITVLIDTYNPCYTSPSQYNTTSTALGCTIIFKSGF